MKTTLNITQLSLQRKQISEILRNDIQMGIFAFLQESTIDTYSLKKISSLESQIFFESTALKEVTIVATKVEFLILFSAFISIFERIMYVFHHKANSTHLNNMQ